MFTKELLNKIKQVTNEILFHSEPVNFETAKLKDSEQEVKYSELAVGSDVSISSSTGDQPAPDGQYDLDSGVSFKVEGGKISEVIEAPQEEELAVADDPQAEDAEQGAEADEAKTDQNVLDKIAELEQAIADIKSALDESKQAEDSEAKAESEEFSKLKNDVKSIAEVLNALANTPAEFSKSDSRIESQDSKQQKLAHLASIISKK